ncbi:uncharacterized protein [Halyomorpha halys]|uniref:uncharacterized protein isoform X1 n=1 Tax=Halyomorpha halys TaxID=286706 RepID=UPI0006D5243E|nr:uncharacterized protein LOC106689233 isoform X1 [Halyomorpha halys]
MSSRWKSKSDRKSKKRHHSKSHRRSHGKRTEFIEPLYFVDTMQAHSNNVPLFFQAPLHGPSQPSWKPFLPVGYINPTTSPVFPNVNHPTQLSIGPLYLLAERSPPKDCPIILESAHSNSADMIRPMKNDNLNELLTNVRKNENTASVNLGEESYYLPPQTEANDVINTWKSQHCTKNMLIDKPTHYGYGEPTTKTMPRLSTRWSPKNNYITSETRNLTSLCNESSNLSEEESRNSVLLEHPQAISNGDLTVMRMIDRNGTNQGEEIYDFNSHNTCGYQIYSAKTSRTAEVSTPHQNVRWNCQTPGNNRETRRKIYIKEPQGMNDLNKERSTYYNVKNGVRCCQRQMNIKTESSKRRNCPILWCMKRSDGKKRTLRGMTTEDSINDLYRKINDIQSTIGASAVNGLLAKEVGHHSRSMDYPVPSKPFVPPRKLYYDSDTAVTGTNSITRGISPINLRSIENTVSCCCSCCHHCERNAKERGLSTPSCTSDINTLTEFPNRHYETGSFNDGIHDVNTYYPQTNTSFQPDTDILGKSSPINQNIRIVIDHEGKCQCQSSSSSQTKHDPFSLPMQQICSRPCYCPQNTLHNPYTTTESCESKPFEKNYLAMKDNSTSCSLSDTPPSYGKTILQSRQEDSDETSFGMSQPCLCSPNTFNSCHCAFSQELRDIMDQIEDKIILKLESKRLFVSDKAPDQSPADIKNIQKAKLNNTAQNIEQENVNIRTQHTKSDKIQKTKLNNTAQNIEQENINIRTQPTKLEELTGASPLRPIVISSGDTVIEKNFGKSKTVDDPNGTGTVNTVKGRPNTHGPGYSMLPIRTSAGGTRYVRGSWLKKNNFPGNIKENKREQSRTSSNDSSNSGRRRRKPAFKKKKPNTMQVLTAIPYVERYIESTKDEKGVSRDNIPSGMHYENDILSLSSSTVEKNENDGEMNKSFQIRRIRLPGPKKHIYILVKKRNERKNTTIKESKETVQKKTSMKRSEAKTSMVSRANFLKEVSTKKKIFFKGLKPKKIRRIFPKESKGEFFQKGDVRLHR